MGENEQPLKFTIIFYFSLTNFYPMDDDGWILLILGALGLLTLASILMGKPQVTVGASVPPSVLQPVISNEETWNWTDWQGKQRSIEIHRTVKTGG